MLDPLVEKSRQVREQLVAEFGGLDGLFDKLEEMDRERLKVATARKKFPRKPSSGGKASRSKRSK